jgi:sec-independent protein translocase protein TatC
VKSLDERKKKITKKTGSKEIEKNNITVSVKKKSIKKNPGSVKKKSADKMTVKYHDKKNTAGKLVTDKKTKRNSAKKSNLSETTGNEHIDPKAIARGDIPMSIVEHLTELRSRLLIVVVSFFIFICVGFYFSDILVHIINKPFLLTGNKLHIFTLAGGFIVKMKVSAAFALIILLPMIVFQIWRFISPAIETPDRHFSRLIIIFAAILFYSGILFVFLILPSAVKVLLGFINPMMFSTIGANDYLHFIFFLAFIMGILFELPVLILILTRIGLITPHFLIRKRKYAFIIIWIIAAIVTPGSDILSQTLIGVPLMLLYEISIVISKFVLIRKKRKELIHNNS